MAFNIVAASGAAAEREPLVAGGKLGGTGKRKIDEQAVLMRVNRHLIPIFFVMTVLCYIDRTNLAYAALQLNTHLGFSDYVYGLGASIFFLGYSLFQVPSNLMLVRVGATRWMSIIVVAWGIVATSFAFMRTADQFYVLRFMLGLTESGTFPGMWYHMSLFLSEKEIGLAYSYVVAGTTLSQVVASPLAAALLALDGTCGLAGWQWLFVVEGLPTIALGCYINRRLAESPLRAPFLSPEEREWLHQRNQRLKAAKVAAGSGVEVGGWGAVRNWRTWYLAIICLMEAVIKNAIMYYCPLILAGMLGRHQAGRHAGPGRSLLSGGPALVVTGGKGQQVVAALVTALPFGTAAAAMLFCAKHSQATGERRYHMTVPLVIGSVALLIMSRTLETAPMIGFAALICGTLIWGPAGIIYGLPATFLHGPAAATGIAVINSIGNLGGMIGPALMGFIKHRDGSYSNAIVVFAVLAALTAVMVFHFPLEGLQPVTVRTFGKGPVTAGEPDAPDAATKWPTPDNKDTQ